MSAWISTVGLCQLGHPRLAGEVSDCAIVAPLFIVRCPPGLRWVNHWVLNKRSIGPAFCGEKEYSSKSSRDLDIKIIPLSPLG